MVIVNSDYEGPAIQTLGSLFKVTQVFLWDDGLQVPPSTEEERSKLAEAEADDDNHDSDPVPDWSDLILLEDLELTRQMNELGLPICFQTNKEKFGAVKGKRKGARSKLPRTCNNPADGTLNEVSAEEVVSPAKFHDKTNSSLCCISMPGQCEASCDGAVEVDMARCASDEGDNQTRCTGFASGVSEEKKNNINDAETNDAQRSAFLISDVSVDLKITPASDTGVSAGSHLTGDGVNFCGIEFGEIDNEFLGLSPIVCKNTDCETICSDDGAATWQPPANESESLPTSMEGIGYVGIDVSNNCGEFGD